MEWDNVYILVPLDRFYINLFNLKWIGSDWILSRTKKKKKKRKERKIVKSSIFFPATEKELGELENTRAEKNSPSQHLCEITNTFHVAIPFFKICIQTDPASRIFNPPQQFDAV